MQVCDWPGEARGAERGGPADPTDAGAGEMAERNDGTTIQPLHGGGRRGDVWFKELQKTTPFFIALNLPVAFTKLEFVQ